MRNWFNRFGVLVVIVALLGAGLGFYFWGGRAKAASAVGTKAFYVDEETGDESVRPVTEVPPLMGKEGKATLVQAIKYSCDGGKTTKVAYLMKYTPEGKEALDRMNRSGEQPNINMMANVLVRLPASGSRWYSTQANEGTTVMETLPCVEGVAKIIVPPQN